MLSASIGHPGMTPSRHQTINFAVTHNGVVAAR